MCKLLNSYKVVNAVSLMASGRLGLSADPTARINNNTAEKYIIQTSQPTMNENPWSEEDISINAENKAVISIPSELIDDAQGLAPIDINASSDNDHTADIEAEKEAPTVKKDKSDAQAEMIKETVLLKESKKKESISSTSINGEIKRRSTTSKSQTLSSIQNVFSDSEKIAYASLCYLVLANRNKARLGGGMKSHKAWSDSFMLKVFVYLDISQEGN
jgi:hypothetical protein